jgi:two-component system CheB/CheR fusion protein
VPIKPRYGTQVDQILLSAYEGILEEFVPPSLLLNEQHELLYVFGGAEVYLTPKGGRASPDVLNQFNSDIRIALAGAIQRATKQQLSVTLPNIQVATRNGARQVNIAVHPIRNRAANSWFMLIVFNDQTKQEPLQVEEPPLVVSDVSRDRIQGLENELSSTKENLQATIEELEASNEELQATNEELTASNEELQSTNEELQSVNEELYTVNAEYQRKIRELTELTSDMENLLASTKIGTIFLDRDLLIRKFTPEIGRLFELLPHDIGRRVDVFAPHLNTNLVDNLNQVIQSGQALEQEVQDRTGNWYLMRMLPYRMHDQVHGAVVTLIDITRSKKTAAELSETDRLLRAILKNSRTCIFAKDLSGRYLLANHHCFMKLGVDPQVAIGKTDMDFFPVEVATKIQANDLLVARTNETHEFEETVPLREGGQRTFLSVKFPIHDEHGEIAAVGAIAADISRQKESEQEQRAKVRARDHFLAILSHELRNPLATIVNASQILDKSPPEPTAKRAKQVIARQSRHVARLLDDLLDVSRLAENKLTLKRSEFDLCKVARECLDALDPFIQEHQHELTLNCSDRPIVIDGDSARIQQVITNLLTNAAKYTPPGTGQIQLSIDSDGSEAVIVVRDNGAGIPPEQLSSIFEMFSQTAQTIDRAEGGIGIGLTLVRSIVELHGGSVTAHSEGLGCGSTFIVRLPLRQQSSRHSHSFRPHSAKTGKRQTFVRPLNILVVEDQADGREMLSALLEMDGHQVRSAANADEALAILEEFIPQLGLIDIGLPGMSGNELARTMRRKPYLQDVFLVACTGFGQPSDFEESSQAGFNTHLVKPVQADRLEQIISTVASKTTQIS